MRSPRHSERASSSVVYVAVMFNHPLGFVQIIRFSCDSPSAYLSLSLFFPSVFSFILSTTLNGFWHIHSVREFLFDFLLISCMLVWRYTYTDDSRVSDAVDARNRQIYERKIGFQYFYKRLFQHNNMVSLRVCAAMQWRDCRRRRRCCLYNVQNMSIWILLVLLCTRLNNNSPNWLYHFHYRDCCCCRGCRCLRRFCCYCHSNLV